VDFVSHPVPVWCILLDAMRPKPLFALSFFLAVLGCADLIPAQNLPEGEILGQAEARIRKYRTGGAHLRLTGTDGKPLRKGIRVRFEQTRHKFLFGANIFMLNRCKTPADNAAYEKEFSALLNYATLPVYWWEYEPQPGHPSYADTERLATWCAAHHIVMKGHPLAWNEGQPSWLPADLAEATRLQMQRITDIVGRFRGGIGIWDVVNEATDFDRESTREGGPTLTAAIREAGVQGWLRTAFGRARQANPQATLVINDYVTGDDYMQKVIAKLVDDSGQPLYDVIGIQCHQHRRTWTAAETWQICERFATTGKPLHFTEATILSGQQGWELRKENPQLDWASTAEGERRQEKEVVQFYTVLFSHPAVQAITWWDLSDQGAWQGAPAGLLRADMTPKPAYEALMRLVKGRWWTRTEARVLRRGGTQFHGFFGDYRVTAQEGGREIAGIFTFDSRTPQPIEVRLE
jgi:endo-1,4-beta-xylanase